MAAKQFFIPAQTAFNSNGLAVPGAQFFFYLPSTTTKTTIYTDGGFSVPASNPVVANGAGRVPTTYLDSSLAYRLKITDANGAVLDDIDPFLPGTFLGTKGDTGPPGSGNLVGFSVDNYCTTNTAAGNTAGLAALSAAVMAAGGGVIDFTPGKSYTIGVQTLVNDGTWMWKPSPLLAIDGCANGVIIRGNGATLKFAAALKYGTFNAAGASTSHSLPYFGGDLSGPTLSGMIAITNCTGPVHVENIDFDGNQANLNAGGVFGDDGRQIPGDGLFLSNNTGGQTVVNVRPHDCPRDGVQIVDNIAASTSKSASHFKGVVSTRNGRQGMSIVGARGYTFTDCKFNDTGTGTFRSSPAAGVDLEQETGTIEDVVFTNCEFANNDGACVLGVGALKRIQFNVCRLLGTRTYALYGVANAIVRDSLILGTFVNIFVSDFVRCTISDDPTLHPSGTVYLSSGWLPDFGGGGDGSTLFDRCTWSLVGLGRGPFTFGTTYRDCSITTGPSATGAASAFGRWEGVNTFSGAHLNQYRPGTIAGKLTMNGTVLLRGSKTYDPPSIAAGANTSTTVGCTGALLGDFVKASFSLDTAGVVLDAYMSANDTATVYLTNKTAGAVDLASGTLSVEAKANAA